MKAELVPENGDPPIRIVRDVTVLGRHRDCDVVIEHPSLSKRHCVLVRTDGLLVIRDLATTNGTKVKGQRVRWAALLPEDRVSFGSYKIKVYLGSDEMLAPSEQRQARDGADGSRAPTVKLPEDPGETAVPSKAGTAPAGQSPRSSTGRRGESSHDSAAAAGRDANGYKPNVSQVSPAAEPALLSGGFELVDEEEEGDDERRSDAFEVLDEFDDDDDIVDLE